MRISILLLLVFVITGCREKHAIVMQTDFGLKDGAVNAMKGVAYSVDPELKIYDLSHEIPAYDIWEAGYRLFQSASFWPQGTVFVSVVDPGVGSERRSIVLKSRSGHFFVTPDNGSLTLVAKSLGIEEVREIDEELNRRKESGNSYTFHGRDVYAFTAARLASGAISFENVGKILEQPLVLIDYQEPKLENGKIRGNIPVLDIQYGNVWTNIHDSIFKKLGVLVNDRINVSIFHNDSIVFNQPVIFANTFAGVPEKNLLGYMNSLMNFSIAVNMGSFADSFRIRSGPDWTIVIGRGPRDKN